jgi:hypothetical protein
MVVDARGVISQGLLKVESDLANVGRFGRSTENEVEIRRYRR